MTRLSIILGAIVSFWVALKTFGRAKKNEGKAKAMADHLGESIKRIEEDDRIAKQLEKDIADLTPDERAILLRDKFTRR